MSGNGFVNDGMAVGRLCRFFYQLAEENAQKKAAKNANKTKWVHF